MMQHESPWREEIGPLVRTQQIIVLAMTGGMLAYLVVAFVIAAQGDAPEDSELPIVSLVALMFAVASVVARMVVVPAIVGAQRKQIAAGVPRSPDLRDQATAELQDRWGDAGRLVGVHQVRTIIAAAMLEGAGFLAITAYLIEGSLWTIALGLALTAGVFAHLPTQAGVVQWVERELQRIEELRRGRF